MARHSVAVVFWCKGSALLWVHHKHSITPATPHQCTSNRMQHQQCWKTLRRSCLFLKLAEPLAPATRHIHIFISHLLMSYWLVMRALLILCPAIGAFVPFLTAFSTCLKYTWAHQGCEKPFSRRPMRWCKQEEAQQRYHTLPNPQSIQDHRHTGHQVRLLVSLEEHFISSCLPPTPHWRFIREESLMSGRFDLCCIQLFVPESFC